MRLIKPAIRPGGESCTDDARLVGFTQERVKSGATPSFHHMERVATSHVDHVRSHDFLSHFFKIVFHLADEHFSELSAEALLEMLVGGDDVASRIPGSSWNEADDGKVFSRQRKRETVYGLGFHWLAGATDFSSSNSDDFMGGHILK